MILIETKVDSANGIYAKIREHSSIADPKSVPGFASVDFTQAMKPHGIYQKLTIQERKYAIHQDGSFAQLSKIGAASGTLDGENLQIHRVDVNGAYRGRGFGLALLQALLQQQIKHAVHEDGTAFLVADASETAELRKYYQRMGFEIDVDYGATDDPQQWPMKAKISVAITNIQIWRAARYSENAAHIVLFS